jgi:hypothetical protein
MFLWSKLLVISRKIGIITGQLQKIDELMGRTPSVPDENPAEQPRK